MKHATRVAVLGAGIMGSSVALYLARRGVPVTLVDAADSPFAGASRWNEGKLHLGYMYSADPSLRTAQHMIEGGLWFRPLVEELLGCDLAPVSSTGDDVYLCHRDSVVTPDAMAAYLARVNDIVRSHPAADRYLADVSRAGVARLDATRLGALTDSDEIRAGFHVPERSVQTRWVADRYVEALAAQRGVEYCMQTRVAAVVSGDGSDQGPWYLDTPGGRLGPFSHVVNARWEGRLAIDTQLGLAPERPWSHRYRLAVFLRTPRDVDGPCTGIATGPVGDDKNSNGRDFDRSWYPAGLVAVGGDVAPPAMAAQARPDDATIAARILAELQPLLPWTTTLREAAASVEVGGGWVFAAGQGQLSDPASTLHERSQYGIRRLGTYLSVDTGKYSTAPWMARELAAMLP